MAFARDPAQLRQLCTVFLDSVEAPAGKDPAARFVEAAKLDGLEERAKALCSLLAETDLGTLPHFAAEQAPSAADEGAASSPAIPS